MTEIITVYKARIDYETTDDHDDATNKVESFSFKICDNQSVYCETFYGNAACNPYILLESEDKERLIEVAGKIEMFISRFKRQLKLIE